MSASACTGSVAGLSSCIPEIYLFFCDVINHDDHVRDVDDDDDDGGGGGGGFPSFQQATISAALRIDER